MIAPTEEQVLAIRVAWDEGRLDARGWAEALDCSLETIRRIGRRDTHRKVRAGPPPSTRKLPEATPTINEPSAEDIGRSLARLHALTNALPAGPQAAREILDELKEQGE